MRNSNLTREQWLHDCVDELRPLLVEAGKPLPKNIKVSCGWPSKGGLSSSYGECWSARLSADSAHEIFISPRIAKPTVVASTLLHELVHAAVGVEQGHRGQFRRAAIDLGFEPPMRSTPPGPALKRRLNALTKRLRPYPHGVLGTELNEIATTAPKPQGTRMLKVMCHNCGCIVRMTAMWLVRVGPPTCGCGGAMSPAV